MKKPIRLVMVEDSETFVRGLTAVLKSEGDFEIVAVADNVESAIREALLHRPDVISVDMQIPHRSGSTDRTPKYGLELIERLRVHVPDSMIVVLTFLTDERWEIQALREDVAAYLNKDLPASRIVTAFRSAAYGQFTRDGRQRQLLREDERDPVTDLTPRELEVLALLAEWMSTEEIADRLNITEATVYKHNQRIFSKLRAKNRSEAVRTAREKAIIP